MSNPVPEVEAEASPTPDEVLQHEAPTMHGIEAVPVAVEGPVNVRQLPAPLWSAVTVTLNDDQPQQLFGREARRKRICVQVTGATCWFGPTRETCDSEMIAFRQSATTSFVTEYTHCGELWVKRDSGNPVVSAFQEFWTE